MVKTRLQSSSSGFEPRSPLPARPGQGVLLYRPSVLHCLRHVLVEEGMRGLFRGLGPNLVGVAPSRAIYFWAYSTSKARLNSSAPLAGRDTPAVHVLSAATAGCVSSVTTNPIWVVKTRLQLDREVTPTGWAAVIRQIGRERGLRGFYLGLSASLYGTSETVLHFVLYEHLKARLGEWVGREGGGRGQDARHFLGLMACGAVSKTVATCAAYPHGGSITHASCWSLKEKYFFS